LFGISWTQAKVIRDCLLDVLPIHAGVDLSWCGRYLATCAEVWVAEDPAGCTAQGRCGDEDHDNDGHFPLGFDVGSIPHYHYNQDGQMEAASSSGESACLRGQPSFLWQRGQSISISRNEDEEDGDVSPSMARGRYQPYLVMVSIEGLANGGGVKIVRARPMSDVVSDGVTSVKLSPSGDFVVLGYGVRTTRDGGVPSRNADGWVRS